MELEGRVALVTGASRGIGKGIALSMAEAGADVVVNYQSNKDGAEQTASEVRAKGRNAMLVQADVKDLSSVKAMVDQAVKVLGKVDILVNNAGIYSAKSFTADDAIETFRDIMETHVFGSLYCTQVVLPSMRAQQRGDIIFITSLAGKQFWAEEWAYATAKNAMSTLAQCIAKELSWHGIRVNCIAPTVVESDMGLDLVSNWVAFDDPKELYNKVPFNRLIQPSDVGNLCVFLASERASHLSGQVIYLDAGVGPGSVIDTIVKSS